MKILPKGSEAGVKDNENDHNAENEVLARHMERLRYCFDVFEARIELAFEDFRDLKDL